MPVPTSINDLSTTPSGNGPNGATDTPSTLDDYQRAIQAILKSECGTLLTAGGTANAITVTTSPTFAANVTGKELWILASAANSGAVTLSVNGISAVAVTKNGTTPLAAGDIPAAGAIFCVKFDGTQYQLLNVAFNPALYALLSGATFTGGISGTTASFSGSVTAPNITALASNAAFLTNLLYPSQDGRWRDIYRAGWMPNFNQQWGGVWYGQMFDSAVDQLKDVEAIAGNIMLDNSSTATFFGNTTGVGWYFYQPFKVSKNITSPQIALRMYKTLNPTDNVVIGIWSDNAGVPNALLGTTSSLSGKLLTSKTDGEYYIFSPAPGALVAGTQYHIVASRSGSVDASNYFHICATSTSKAPYTVSGYGTNVPAWTPSAAGIHCAFSVLATSAVSVLQTGGRFDQALQFSGVGTPINQTDYLWQPLRNFWDGKQFTSLWRGTTFTASQPIKDFQYGIDHDRILLSINASGFAQVDVWDTGGTKRTVTGTSSIASGSHDVGFSIRSVGDGADYMRLFVDGVSVGTPLTSLTLIFDPAFRDSGTATLGGAPAFAVPTWTQNMTFGSLPSAQGWTYSGTATEANAMSVANGKLYQNANGVGATQTAFYTKSAAGLSNANGWICSWKCRAPTTNNNNQNQTVAVVVEDGAKQIRVVINEFFLFTVDGSGFGNALYYQGDFKSTEHVFTLAGKGSDFYLYVDGRPVIDGTGKLTFATAGNQIYFGDSDGTSGNNADGVWSYFKYYTTAAVLPQFTSGSLSENLEFSGNREVILPSLWNAGSPISGKSYLGIGKNYVGEGVVQKEQRYRTTSPTTTSAASVLLTDMEIYTIGGEINTSFNGRFANNTANLFCAAYTAIDGKVFDLDEITVGSSTANALGTGAANNLFKVPVGLHKVNMYWAVQSGGTGTCYYSRFAAEARP